MTQKAKESNAAQYQKFKEAARELETDESEENFDQIVRRIAAKQADPTTIRWVARFYDNKTDEIPTRQEAFEAPPDAHIASQEATRRMRIGEMRVDVAPVDNEE